MGRGTRRSKRSGPSALRIACFVFGGVLTLFAVCAIVAFALNGFSTAGGGLLPNGRVTPENYNALATGATLAEVEAILGPGRAPSASDFDAICGTEREAFTNPFFNDRPMWEYYAGEGQILVWTNGSARILVFFHQPTANGGRLVRKVMKSKDGHINSQGGGVLPGGPVGATGGRPTGPALASVPKVDPDQPLLPPDRFTYTVAELLDECRRNPNTPARFGTHRVTVTTGTYSHSMGIFVYVKTPDGTGKVKTDLSPAGAVAIARKKAGDAVTLTGLVTQYFPTENVLIMANCDSE